jgi:ribonuclease VapC
VTIDSSALIAILFGEAGYLELVDKILEADHPRVGAPTLAETSIVFAARARKAASKVVDGLIDELGISVVPFGEPEWHVAREAYVRFGRGRHPASLNFGDCLAYATARAAKDTLLFVGRDLSKTDITAV